MAAEPTEDGGHAWVCIIAVHLIVLTAVLAASAALTRLDPLSSTVILLFALVGSLVHGLWLRGRGYSQRTSLLLFVTDAALVTWLVYLTGGADSRVAVLYPAIVLGAGLAGSAGSVFVVSAACVTFYAAVLLTTAVRSGAGAQALADVSRVLLLRSLVLTLFCPAAVYLARELARYVRRAFREGGAGPELLNALPIGVLAVSEKREILFANKTAAELLAVPTDRLYGGSLGAWLTHRPPQGAEGGLSEHIWYMCPRAGERVRVELRMASCERPRSLLPHIRASAGPDEQDAEVLMILFSLPDAATAGTPAAPGGGSPPYPPSTCPSGRTPRRTR